MDQKISIIVPVYKVEKYLCKCVDSILSQKYTNIEVILVDDGSPDNCGTICDKYGSSDSRVVVLHKDNGGLSSARNAGLDVATGDYIGFVDSDDYIHSDMYYEMYKFLEDNKCDMVECGVNLINGGEELLFPSGINEVISGEEATVRHLGGKINNGIPRVAVWSKLYKKGFWKNRRFPNGKIHEDYMLTSQALLEAERFGIVNQGLYYHLTDNKDSILNLPFGAKDLYLEEQRRNRVEYYKHNASDEIVKLAENSYYKTLLYLCWRCHYAGLSEENRYIKMIRSLRKDIFSHDIGLLKKCEFAVLIVSPRVYFGARKLLMLLRIV